MLLGIATTRSCLLKEPVAVPRASAVLLPNETWLLTVDPACCCALVLPANDEYRRVKTTPAAKQHAGMTMGLSAFLVTLPMSQPFV